MEVQGQLSFKGLSAADMNDFNAMIQKPAPRSICRCRNNCSSSWPSAKPGSIFSVNPEDAAAGRASMEDINDTLRLMVQSTINGMQAYGYVDVKSGQCPHPARFWPATALKLNGKAFETEPEPEFSEADLLPEQELAEPPARSCIGALT